MNRITPAIKISCGIIPVRTAAAENQMENGFENHNDRIENRLDRKSGRIDNRLERHGLRSGCYSEDG